LPLADTLASSLSCPLPLADTLTSSLSCPLPLADTLASSLSCPLPLADTLAQPATSGLSCHRAGESTLSANPWWKFPAPGGRVREGAWRRERSTNVTLADFIHKSGEWKCVMRRQHFIIFNSTTNWDNETVLCSSHCLLQSEAKSQIFLFCSKWYSPKPKNFSHCSSEAHRGNWPFTGVLSFTYRAFLGVKLRAIFHMKAAI
jgi:hypothetical protein